MTLTEAIEHWTQRADAAQKLGRRYEEVFARGTVHGLRMARRDDPELPLRREPARSMPGRAMAAGAGR